MGVVRISEPMEDERVVKEGIKKAVSCAKKSEPDHRSRWVLKPQPNGSIVWSLIMKRRKQHGQKTESLFSSRPHLFLRKTGPFSWLLRGLLLAFVLQQPAFAHRGDADDVDPCRIKIGNEWIHFAAYTPTISENKSYCRSIPKVGMTNLVFDYEGKQLRHVSIEFEVTKEPEGTRVYYRLPSTTKTGTVEGAVDFNQFGAGNYQVHVTLIENDQKVDTHIPFSVGIEGDESFIKLKKILFTIVICIVIAYLSFRFARGGKGDDKTPEATKS
ncbi:MAG: hypothetical protein ACU83V_12280 [Gammaproteobacteria bacterium]